MPGRVASNPHKRVLTESTKGNQNPVMPSPDSKKRKLNGALPNGKFQSSPAAMKSKLGSSQPKSRFETEVLEKLTQDINGLKENNSEKDQQWERPSLEGFDEKRDSLCFQQIDAEEGTLHGGKKTVKLFGVTEVSAINLAAKLVLIVTDWPLRSAPCHRLPPLPLCCCPCFLRPKRLSGFQSILRDPDRPTPARDPFRANGYAREFVWISGQPEEPVPQNYGERPKTYQSVADDYRKRRRELQRIVERRS